MSLQPQPLVKHQPIEPVFTELHAWVDRYLVRFPDAEWLHQEVIDEPGDAVAVLLRSYATGEWDLAPEDLARLWFIGRAMGWRREELLPDEVLQEALPDRRERPQDPPGRWVQSLLLTGGAHLGGHGAPGKSEFPRHWEPDQIMDFCVDVAQHPDAAVELPSGDFRATGTREQVLMGAMVSPRGTLLTAYPVRGQGVAYNPLSAEQAPAVALLQELLDGLALPAGEEPRVSFDELIAVGEWPYVIESLLAMGVASTHQRRVDLAELHELAGLEIPPWFLNGTG